MIMLDRKDKKSLVNVPQKSRSGNWDEFSRELFAKCLEWPDGPIHSDKAIRVIAGKLVELIESISYFELSSSETKDVREFLDSYELLLQVLEAGPRKANGFAFSRFKPKEKLFETFAKAAKQVVQDIQVALVNIETESRQAQIRHTAGMDSEITKSDPQSKSRLRMSGELSIGMKTLERISQDKPLSAISRLEQNGITSLPPGQNGSIDLAS
jgi:hypothetical protein